MPADRTQLANERIDALVAMLNEEGIISGDTAEALHDAEDIGRAAEVANEHANKNANGQKP